MGQWIWAGVAFVACIGFGRILRLRYPNAVLWKAGRMSQDMIRLGLWNHRLGLGAAAVSVLSFPAWDLHPWLMAFSGFALLAMVADLALRRLSLSRK